MTIFLGKVCVKHPELQGEQRPDGYCRGCARGSGRASMRKRRAEKPEHIREIKRASYCKRLADNTAEMRRKAREYRRAWRKANPEKNREISRRHDAKRYADDLGKVLARNKKWRAEHPEIARESNRKSNRKWITANPEMRGVANGRRRSLRAKAAVPLTWLDKFRIRELYEIAKARTTQTGVEHHVDHDRPLVLGGLHHPDNLMVVPAAINLAKGARYNSTMEFLLS